MLDDGEDDLPWLDPYDFTTEPYTTGPGREVVGRFSFEGPDPDTGDVWLHVDVDTYTDHWVPIKLTPNDRRSLVAILDMADDGGEWADEWNTRYRGSDIRSALSLLAAAVRIWARSQWRSAISTKTATRSWRSIFRQT